MKVYAVYLADIAAIEDWDGGDLLVDRVQSIWATRERAEDAADDEVTDVTEIEVDDKIIQEIGQRLGVVL